MFKNLKFPVEDTGIGEAQKKALKSINQDYDHVFKHI